jgi:hypothetical protein
MPCSSQFPVSRLIQPLAETPSISIYPNQRQLESLTHATVLGEAGSLIGIDQSCYLPEVPVQRQPGASHLTRRVFGSMVRGIAALPVSAGWTKAVAAIKSIRREASEGEVTERSAEESGISGSRAYGEEHDGLFWGVQLRPGTKLCLGQPFAPWLGVY